MVAPPRAYPEGFFLLASGLILMAVSTAPATVPDTSLTVKELSALSLEELMQVTVSSPAAITHLKAGDAPASVTVLDSEAIRRTPARNLYDLIEIYVPGAIWMNFEEGPLVGVRGSIGNQNGKYLLLVNGKVLSSKDHFGARSEMESWDLGDIEKVEIIRGPGSVVHGPGAVAGVISITTHNARSFEGVRFSGGYLHTYGSTGGAVSAGGRIGGSGYLAYASITRTPGYTPLNFQGSNANQPGYVGRDINVAGEPLDYFSDYQDQPQAKLHLDLDLPGNWSAWARYTQQGAAWSGNESKAALNGELLNQQGIRDRQISSEVEYSRFLLPDLELQARAGAVSFDLERRTESIRTGDPDHPENFRYNFSETEYMTGARLNFLPVPWLEAAAGTEVSWDSIGPGWWDAPETMRMGGDGIIVSGPDSRVIGPVLPLDRAVFAGDGWSTMTFSGYAEAKIHGRRYPTLLLSARVDKNSNSRWLLSPRTALIQSLPGGQTLKGIVQRSEHRNESGELFIEKRNGTRPSHETLVSYELIYQAPIRKSIQAVLAFYFNDADIISWDPDVDRSLPLGSLKLGGVEAEIAWSGASGRLGANYSILQMVDWRMAEGVNASGISYSEYRQPMRGSSAVQTGYGEDLNNWPNQALKAFGNLAVTERLNLHANAQMFWDWQGSLDGLAALERTAQGDSLESQVEEALRKVREQGVFEMDCRINLSAQYVPIPRLRVEVSILNLLGTVANRRLSYDEGNNRLSPHRIRFTREDRAVGISVGYAL